MRNALLLVALGLGCASKPARSGSSGAPSDAATEASPGPSVRAQDPEDAGTPAYEMMPEAEEMERRERANEKAEKERLRERERELREQQPGSFRNDQRPALPHA